MLKDAVCFVSNAGSARLTPAQKYIFDKIITSFGDDVKQNVPKAKIVNLNNKDNFSKG